MFKISPAAVDINDTRALHVAELTRDALRNMGRYIAGADVLICGASYRQDVGDTRYSGSEMVVCSLPRWAGHAGARSVPRSLVRARGARRLSCAGPFVVAVLPQPGGTDKTSACRRTCPTALKHAEALILAVPHEQYLDSRSRSDRQVGRRPAGGDRLFRHPFRRQDPPLLRARLRSESPRPRPHPAHQGADPREGEVILGFGDLGI